MDKNPFETLGSLTGIGFFFMPLLLALLPDSVFISPWQAFAAASFGLICYAIGVLIMQKKVYSKNFEKLMRLAFIFSYLPLLILLSFFVNNVFDWGYTFIIFSICVVLEISKRFIDNSPAIFSSAGSYAKSPWRLLPFLALPTIMFWTLFWLEELGFINVPNPLFIVSFIVLGFASLFSYFFLQELPIYYRKAVLVVLLLMLTTTFLSIMLRGLVGIDSIASLDVFIESLTFTFVLSRSLIAILCIFVIYKLYKVCENYLEHVHFLR